MARRVSAHSIARVVVVESIEFEIQAWINRETVEALARALREEATTTIHHEDASSQICLATVFFFLVMCFGILSTVRKEKKYNVC